MTELRTTDTELSAYLLTLGHPVVRVEGPRGKRTFVLANVSDEDRIGYFADSKLVSARQLFSSYRTLKKLIFEAP